MQAPDGVVIGHKRRKKKSRSRTSPAPAWPPKWPDDEEEEPIVVQEDEYVYYDDFVEPPPIYVQDLAADTSASDSSYYSSTTGKRRHRKKHHKHKKDRHSRHDDIPPLTMPIDQIPVIEGYHEKSRKHHRKHHKSRSPSPCVERMYPIAPPSPFGPPIALGNLPPYIVDVPAVRPVVVSRPGTPINLSRPATPLLVPPAPTRVPPAAFSPPSPTKAPIPGDDLVLVDEGFGVHPVFVPPSSPLHHKHHKHHKSHKHHKHSRSHTPPLYVRPSSPTLFHRVPADSMGLYREETSYLHNSSMHSTDLDNSSAYLDARLATRLVTRFDSPSTRLTEESWNPSPLVSPSPPIRRTPPPEYVPHKYPREYGGYGNRYDTNTRHGHGHEHAHSYKHDDYHHHSHSHHHHHHHDDKHHKRYPPSKGHSEPLPEVGGYVSPYSGKKLVASTPYYRPPGVAQFMDQLPPQYSYDNSGHLVPYDPHTTSDYPTAFTGNSPDRYDQQHHGHHSDHHGHHHPGHHDQHGRHGHGHHDHYGPGPHGHHDEPNTYYSNNSDNSFHNAPHHNHYPNDPPTTLIAPGGGGHGISHGGGGHGMSANQSGGHGIAQPNRPNQTTGSHGSSGQGHGMHAGAAAGAVGVGAAAAGAGAFAAHQHHQQETPPSRPQAAPQGPPPGYGQGPPPGYGHGPPQSPPDMLHGDVYAIVHSCARLPKTDMFSKTDAFVRLKLGKTVGPRTRTINNDDDPEFEEFFRLPVSERHDHLVFEVYDDDSGTANDYIGRVTLPITQVRQGIKGQHLNIDMDMKYRAKNKGAQVVVSAWFVAAHESSRDPDLKYFTRFPAREHCGLKLYSNAVWDDPKAIVPVHNTPDYNYSKNYFHDVYEAIQKAQHFIYICGWSVWTKLQLIRDEDHPTGGSKLLGDILQDKAERGVKVLVMVWDDSTSNFLYKSGLMCVFDEETKKFFSSKGDKVKCVGAKRNNDSTNEDAFGLTNDLSWGMMFTHHQKSVICDADPLPGSRHSGRRVVAFVGGIDLTSGRYDTPSHPLFRTLKTIHADDYYNGDIPKCKVDLGPREPWHDIHGFVEGPIAHDVKKNFEERWAKQGKKWSREIVTYQDGHSNKLVPRDQDLVSSPQQWVIQMFRSIDYVSIDKDERALKEIRLPIDGKLAGPPSRHLTMGGSNCERTIQYAYIHWIRRAERFIYIENQYFLGSASEWSDPKLKASVPCRNRIPAEIAARIVEKIYARQPFHCYVLLPCWPEGIPESKSVQPILKWQFHTVSMMYERIATALRDAGNRDAKPTDYLSFYCLGTKEPVTNNAQAVAIPNTIEDRYREILKHRRHPVYVHCKMIIVDDYFVLFGSANINDRSLAGDRDSEIAVGCWQPAFMKPGSKSDVFHFRVGLFAEHLATNDEVFGRPETVQCARRIQQLAEENWRAYDADEVHEQVKPLPHGFLMNYQYNIQNDGVVTVRNRADGKGTFPDNDKALVDGAQTAIPHILTT